MTQRIRNLFLSNGDALPVAFVNLARMYDVLHIHVDGASVQRLTETFSDKEATARMIYRHEDGEDVFSGYTNLLGIQLDPLGDNPTALLVRLGRSKNDGS